MMYSAQADFSAFAITLFVNDYIDRIIACNYTEIHGGQRSTENNKSSVDLCVITSVDLCVITTGKATCPESWLLVGAVQIVAEPSPAGTTLY